MPNARKQTENQEAKKGASAVAPGLFGLMRRYLRLIGLLTALTVVASGISVAVPKMISIAIDTYSSGSFFVKHLVLEFSVVAALIFIFTYLQNIVQVYVSERVARDLRNELTAAISVQPYAFIESATPAKLLTNLTSDVDAVKTFISMAVSSLISSIFLIVAVSVLLIMTDLKLALLVLAIMPLIAGTFFFVFGRVRKLFVKSQEAIDWLNKVISESILGAALIRLINSQKPEFDKFEAANAEAKRISLRILALFSGLIPVISFLANLAILAIVMLGGRYVITGSMTLGSFTAFNSYLAILIFPIIIIGFISNVIAQAQASYGRIVKVMSASAPAHSGTRNAELTGAIEVKDLTVRFGDKVALKDISFSAKAGSRTAVIGPTAAGKTQLLYAMTGLIAPSSGEILYDGHSIDEYDKQCLANQIGFVFQDSVMFNLSLRENIAFSNTVKDASLEKAIATAELNDFIEALPNGLDTVISERGTSLSGGQKQRVMLARALALDPKILLLDDFTARVDNETERKILKNVVENYPGLTLISVTQKISSIEQYDQIILLMEGELIASGTHEKLMAASPEYVQIFESQRSTSEYELDNGK
jgi:ATP-binding cassette subfamily B protein